MIPAKIYKLFKTNLLITNKYENSVVCLFQTSFSMQIIIKPILWNMIHLDMKK